MFKLFRSSCVLALLAGFAVLTAVAQKPTLTRNQDEAGRNPYQQYVAFNQSSSTCPNNFVCQALFPPVPSGYRLVVTHVSAYFKLITGGNGAIVTLGFDNSIGGTHIVIPATSIGDSTFVASSSVMFFVEAGSSPSLVLEGLNVDRTNQYAAQTSIVGYLVALP